ncbi:MAG: hypothetical protein MJE68_18110, partial [Proteobacteria bacterium]|nr:hypothetical protein [Pseudomonadota bacterium]
GLGALGPTFIICPMCPYYKISKDNSILNQSKNCRQNVSETSLMPSPLHAHVRNFLGEHAPRPPPPFPKFGGAKLVSQATPHIEGCGLRD